MGNIIDLRTSVTNPPTYVTPSTDIIIDYNYYLSRVDNIILNSKGVFTVIRGVPSLTPKTPVDSDDSITLYTIHIPAFTFKSSDVSVDKRTTNVTLCVIYHNWKTHRKLRVLHSIVIIGI